MTGRLVVISEAELGELVRNAVADALEAAGTRERAPALLDRSALARALDVSLATLDRLRSEPGFPEYRLADAPRFELAEVLAWLRDRQQAARVAEGQENDPVARKPNSPSPAGNSGTRLKAPSRKSSKSRNHDNGAGRPA